jgi:hypothetical protein
VLDSFGANTVRSAAAVGDEWLAANARTVAGKTVLRVDGERRTLPRADLRRIA